jgi:hypothetical protein
MIDRAVPVPSTPADPANAVADPPLWDTPPPVGAWRSLVARTVRVGEVPGSNPGAPIELIDCDAGDRSWRYVAKQAGLDDGAIDEMVLAFEQGAGCSGAGQLTRGPV